MVNLSTLIACLAYCASTTEIFHVNKSVFQCPASRVCTYYSTCTRHLQLASPSFFSSDSVVVRSRQPLLGWIQPGWLCAGLVHWDPWVLCQLQPAPLDLQASCSASAGFLMAHPTAPRPHSPPTLIPGDGEELPRSLFNWPGRHGGSFYTKHAQS